MVPQNALKQLRDVEQISFQ